jgi:sugar-phosphatase
MSIASNGAWQWYGEAVLFDLDGTLVDSSASVARNWRWVADHVGVPFEAFEPYIHGIPTQQVLRTVLTDWSKPDLLALGARQLVREAEDNDDVVALPGALEVLDQLPSNRWAIVTSGDLRLATARIRAAGLPAPRVLVTSEDVARGKPDPAPYLAGAARLGFATQRCVVVEDAPAGVSSALAAGMPVLGVLTSSTALDGVDRQVADLSEVSIEVDRQGVRISA